LILDYIKRKWLFLLIVLILLLLNIWVWFINEAEREIKLKDALMISELLIGE